MHLVRGLSLPRQAIVQVLLYLLLLLTGFELYHAISMDAPRRHVVAYQHAAAIISFERNLGILWEPEAQRIVLHVDPRAETANASLHHIAQYLASRIYKGGQAQWVLALLFWLYLFRPHLVKRMLGAIIITSLAAEMIAALWPTAPPRFALAGPPYFMHDITGVPGSERLLVQAAGFNPYASFPSVHVLWALLTGLGLWYAAPGRTARAAACLFPAAIVAAVVITGNHYLIDCVASALLLAIYLTLQHIVARVWSRFRARPRVAARPIGVLESDPRQILALCASASSVLVLAGDALERLVGVLLLAAGAGMIVIAQRQGRAGRQLRPPAPALDWWCAVLFLAGSTAIDAHQPLARLAASLLWFAAVTIPMAIRLWTAAQEPPSTAQPVVAYRQAYSRFEEREQAAQAS